MTMRKGKVRETFCGCRIGTLNSMPKDEILFVPALRQDETLEDLTQRCHRLKGVAVERLPPQERKRDEHTV